MNIEKTVNEFHITADGTPRSIHYSETQGLWKTKMPGRRWLTAKTKEALERKILEYYTFGGSSKNAVKNVCEMAYEYCVKEKENEEATVRKHRSNLNKSGFIERFGNTDIQKVTRQDIIEFFHEYASTHPTKGDISNLRGSIKMLFDYAIGKGIYTGEHPVLTINIKTYQKRLSRKKKDNFITQEETDELVKYTCSCLHRTHRKMKEYNLHAVLLATYTGMRVGEICALKWEDISDTHIWIHSQQVERPEGFVDVDYTKNEKDAEETEGRNFPIDANIRAVLELIKTYQKHHTKSEYLFVNANGKRVNTKGVNSALHTIATHLGLPTGVHTLRKSYNQNVLINKLHLTAEERAALIGHLPETNKVVYTKTERDKSRMREIDASIINLPPNLPLSEVYKACIY